MRKLIGSGYHMCFSAYMPKIGYIKEDYKFGRIQHIPIQDLANGNDRWIWTKI